MARVEDDEDDDTTGDWATVARAEKKSGREIKLSDSASNMFREYTGLRDKIIDKFQLEELDVVLISLGPTPTVFTAELSCRGFTAIDVGHFGGNSRRIRVHVALSLYNSLDSFLG